MTSRGVTEHRHRQICENIREEVYHLLDGRLAAKARQEVLAHLRACPACFSKYELERILRRVVRGKVTAEECPKSLLGRIKAAITCEAGRRVLSGRRVSRKAA